MLIKKLNIKSQQKGFSLVELAVVLVIAGTLLGAGLKVASAVSARSALSTTKQRQQVIKEALINYIARTGRLPCPDQNASPDGTDDDRTSASPAQCTSYAGSVPYKDLGLDRDIAVDGWDNYFTYVLSSNWQLTYNPSAAVGDKYQTSNIANAFVPGLRSGTITVLTRTPTTNSTTSVLADPATNTGAAVVIISYGPNGKGARNISNNINDAPTAGTDEASNVTISSFQVYERDYSDIDTPTIGAFDDVVLAVSPDDIYAPLIKSGGVQDATVASVLSRATDHVIGQLAATKTACPILFGFCPSGEYYYTLPSTITNFPEDVSAWNLNYSPNTSSSARIYSNNTNGGTALTLSVTARGVTTSKMITIQELKGIMAVVSGFD